MKRLLTTVCALVLCALPAYAHPGGTDANGGHYDRSSGEYHYHHGFAAHSHEGGVCPLDAGYVPAEPVDLEEGSAFTEADESAAGVLSASVEMPAPSESTEGTLSVSDEKPTPTRGEQAAEWSEPAPSIALEDALMGTEKRGTLGLATSGFLLALIAVGGFVSAAKKQDE